MTTGEHFKNFIKDEDVNQENFIEFIENNFDEIVEEYSLGEVIDFVIYHGDSWKLGVILSLNPDIFIKLDSLSRMIAQSGKVNLIHVLNKNFWKKSIFDVFSVCVKLQFTDFICEFIKKIDFELDDITDIEFINLNKIFYYSCLRNEYENIKVLIKAGANPGFSFEGVNSITILKRNIFTKSFSYVSRKFPLVLINEKQILMKDEIYSIIEDYKKGKRIEDLSFYIAKFGGNILNEKNEKGDSLFEQIIETGNVKFFRRMFAILNDNGESTIKDLVSIAKKLNQEKIMNILIEESVK